MRTGEPNASFSSFLCALRTCIVYRHSSVTNPYLRTSSSFSFLSCPGTGCTLNFVDTTASPICWYTAVPPLSHPLGLTMNLVIRHYGRTWPSVKYNSLYIANKVELTLLCRSVFLCFEPIKTRQLFMSSRLLLDEKKDRIERKARSRFGTNNADSSET